MIEHTQKLIELLEKNPDICRFGGVAGCCAADFKAHTWHRCQAG